MGRIKWIIPIVILCTLFLIGVFLKGKETSDNKISKEEIIQIYKDNAEPFSTIQKYAEETEGDMYAYVDPSMRDVRDGRNGIEIDDYIKEKVDQITNKLKIDTICEGEEDIWFIVDNGDPIRGILYLKGEIMSDVIYVHEKIAEDWYYFETREMGGI